MPEDQILDSDIKAQLPQMDTEPKPWYKNPKVIISGILAALLVLGISWYFLWGRMPQTNFTSTKVTVNVKGPAQVSSGSEAEFRIMYHNGENADMLNVKLDMIYPTNFQFKSSTPGSLSGRGQSFNLPVVRAGEDAEVVVRGKLTGATGESKQILAKLHYSLSNFSSSFVVEATGSTTIQAPNLTLDISGSLKVPAGQDTGFSINYTNVSNQDYENVAIMAVYPPGFRYASSSVKPAKNNNYWLVGRLPVGVSGKIDVSGSFVGQNFEEQLVTVSLGQVINNNYAVHLNSTATFQLTSPPITISQTLEPSSVVNLGDTVNVVIKYQNTSSQGLTNLVITNSINSNLVDTSRITVPDAVITGTTITWKAATNSNLSILSPGRSGQVQYSLPLKASLPSTLKNNVITSTVTAVSSEITTPVHSADAQLKLATDFEFNLNGRGIGDAFPLQVGKKSTFAITFMLSNTANDMDNVVVSANLPLPASAWTSIVVPESEKSRLTYDSGSGKITWNVGNLPAYAGQLSVAPKVTFQISVTPQSSDQNQALRLLTNVIAAGRDMFTDQAQTLVPIDQFTTTDMDDAEDDLSGGTVE